MVSKMTTQGAQARAQKEASDEALATPLQDPSSAGSSERLLRRIAIFTVATDTIQIGYRTNKAEQALTSLNTRYYSILCFVPWNLRLDDKSCQALPPTADIDLTRLAKGLSWTGAYPEDPNSQDYFHRVRACFSGGQ